MRLNRLRACLSLSPMLVAAGACKPDYDVNAQARILSTSVATVDAGMVAVNDRERVQIFLRSTGQGEVAVSGIEVDDPTHWEIDPSWKNADGDDNAEALNLAGGTPDDPIYGLAEIIFKPDAEDEYRTTLTIYSNDTEVTERDPEDESVGLWKIVLRGIGRYPCSLIYPTFHDYGPRPPGGYYSHTGYIQNCGVVTLTVTSFDVAGDATFSVATPTPVYVLPGETEPVEFAYQPGGSSDGEQALVTLESTDPSYADQQVRLIGNECSLSVMGTWDGDGDGWTSCGGDCDDTDSSISPSAQEKSSNGKDDNCNGVSDEAASDLDVDDDGDTYTENTGDADDSDPTVYPSAPELLDQIDNDGDSVVDEGTIFFDDDGDGYSEREGDCNDGDNLIHPGAEEALNEIDEDCDGLTDETTYAFDDDRDGFAEQDPSGGAADCDDEDPWTYPQAAEDCDDHDNDCDGLVDEGSDDEPDGACAFLVERNQVQEKKEGCSTSGRPAAIGVGWSLGLAGLLMRRRRRA